ncbi:sulfatase-like hydrolase/transferase [bacterium]|nr:sulfatase-like hydrolase/transferase [bacterium]
MYHSRREFLTLLAASGITAAVPNFLSCSGLLFAGKRPNIIIFLGDDLGYGDLGCYGNPIIKTPHIDAFAKEGVRFTDCHAAGTVCSPSRAGLLTGRNPYRSGFYYIADSGAWLRTEEKTIASLLRESGYDTCYAGKWHLSHFNRDDSQPDPGDHGFDHWFATPVNAFEGPDHPTTFVRNGVRVPEVDGWYCDAVVRESLEWLRNRPDPEKPFFLVVATHEPHTPLAPPEHYAAMYDNQETDELEKRIRYGGVVRPDREIGLNKKYYYGTVSQLDAAFGNLMRGLDDLRLAGNSLVFFTSDNGPESPVNMQESKGEWDDPIRDRCFGTPGQLRGMKRFTYEGGHRIPGILRWPGRVRPGSVCGTLVNGTDILPTVCEAASIQPPRDRTIDGTSILPLFSGKQLQRDIPQCWFFPAYEDAMGYIPQMAMRIGSYTLLGWFDGKRPGERYMDWLKRAQLISFELYNVNADEAQQKDISADCPEILNRLIPRMRELWKDIQKEGPCHNKWTAH